MDYKARFEGMYDFLWSHAFISDEVHDGITLNCNFTSDATISDTCQAFRNQAKIGKIFIYDVYAPLCTWPPSSSPSVCF